MLRQLPLQAATLLCVATASQSIIAQDLGQQFQTLYTFTGDKSNGYAGLPRDLTIGDGGVLYGVTSADGPPFRLTPAVFALNPPASPGGAWTETTLHSFTGHADDGYYPEGLVAGPYGILYGTTYEGGMYSSGVIFSLIPPASPGGAWVEKVIYNFPYGEGNPNPGLAIDQRGVLYGTLPDASPGGSCCSGAVFSLSPPATAGSEWTETILHYFTGAPGDGLQPRAGVVIGNGGILYGTTSQGGSAPCRGSGCGMVFSLAPVPGDSWTETVIYNFTGSPGDGNDPLTRLALGAGGVLYGTTYEGGTFPCLGYGCGTIFALAPPASPGGAWIETILHNFSGEADGFDPSALATGSDGTLYGTSETPFVDAGAPCGQAPPNGAACGAVFSLRHADYGDEWSTNVLHYFPNSPGAGAYPSGGVIAATAPDGHTVLYGITEVGGTSGYGTVFEIRP